MQKKPKFFFMVFKQVLAEYLRQFFFVFALCHNSWSYMLLALLLCKNIQHWRKNSQAVNFQFSKSSKAKFLCVLLTVYRLGSKTFLALVHLILCWKVCDRNRVEYKKDEHVAISAAALAVEAAIGIGQSHYWANSRFHNDAWHFGCFL